MLVVAHRTCPEHAKENSIGGIVIAAELGADAVEVDVRLTRDGVPVLVHDQHLLRVAHRPVWIHRATAHTVARHGIPTLRAALDALPDRLGIALDMKADEAGLAAVDAATAAGVLDRSRLWTRSLVVARQLRERVGRDVEVALLRDTSSRDENERFIDDAVAAQVNAISAAWDAIDDVFVAAARERGLRVYSWCRTRGAHVEKVHLLDGLVTDWPEDVPAPR